MIAALLIGLALAVAALTALSLRPPSALSALLAGYLALVANLALVTWALSPFHAVTRGGLFAAEAVLLAAAGAVWWLRGRPGLPTHAARAAFARIASDPVTVAFLLVVFAALAYELVLAVTVPANNYDSLTYHLSRAASWKQHAGIEWIQNAPSDRLNEFQPIAEQQILYLFVAAGSGALFALPQYVAQLAILVAVYGASRRLGFDQRAAACSSALLATFSLFALEATTAQNDLVSAAFPVTAACLLLGGGSLEAILAGAALGIGLGVKLTTLLTWPVLAWLAWLGGKRDAIRTAAGAAAAFLAVSVWSFVLNAVHTGHLLGRGGGRTDQAVSPSVVTMLHTFLRIVYRTLDLALLSNRRIWELAAVGIAVAAATAAVAFRRRSPLLAVAAVAAPLLAPALVLELAPVVAWVGDRVNLPVRDPLYGFLLNRSAEEDFSAFGPLGALALFGAPLVVLAAHRVDRRRLALAVAFPSYVLLLGLYAKYNIWIVRFLIVPAALTAPLFGVLARGRAAVAGLAAVGALSVGGVLEHNANKPFDGNSGRPWNMSQADALRQTPAQPGGRRAADAIAAYARLVPAGSRVGAVLDPDEWSYLLWGPRLQNRIFFLPSSAAVETAIADDLRYVVVSTGANAPIADRFKEAGWKVAPLGLYWNLAVSP